MASFIPVSPDSDFSIHNIPFGVFSDNENKSRRCGTIIGNTVIDLRFLSDKGYLSAAGDVKEWFAVPNLNVFASQPLASRRKLRETIQALFKIGSRLDGDTSLSGLYFDISVVQLHLPVNIGDYTDFCASVHHTTNAGRLMKVPGPPLPPAWSHLPIGYHGRASSIIPSGVPFRRPRGLRPPIPNSTDEGPTFGPTRSLDMEYEMAAVVGGTGNEMGAGVGVEEVEEYVFGLVMMNDWSAREIQGFEMIPLGPFNGKNFATTISPWIVTLDALKPFKTTMAEIPDAPVLAEYLREKDQKPTYDLPLTMSIQGAGDATPTMIMNSNLKHLSYSFGQLIAHHTISGCPLRAGDILASGTISGPFPDSLACLLEITARGSQPIDVGGKKKIWLEDGDSVKMFAQARRIDSGVVANVGFGECEGTVLPAIDG